MSCNSATLLELLRLLLFTTYSQSVREPALYASVESRSDNEFGQYCILLILAISLKCLQTNPITSPQTNKVIVTVIVTVINIHKYLFLPSNRTHCATGTNCETCADSDLTTCTSCETNYVLNTQGQCVQGEQDVLLAMLAWQHHQ